MVCVEDDHDYCNMPVGEQYENVTVKLATQFVVF